MTETAFNQPPHPPRRPFLQEFWYIFLFIFALIAIAVAFILRALTPPPTNQPNSWNEITPGYSKIDQVNEKLGPPIDQEAYGGGTKYSYQSNYPTLPNNVITDAQGIVRFVKEYTPADSTENLAEYIEKYGQPDLQLYDEETGDSEIGNIFLEEGIVVFAHIADNSVKQKWYFEPTTRDNFLAAWGQNLTAQEDGPEVLNP